MATSPLIPHPGNFNLQQRNQNKNPPLAAKPAQQEDGVVEERRRGGENNAASLSGSRWELSDSSELCVR